jgi:hypothetical protein
MVIPVDERRRSDDEEPLPDPDLEIGDLRPVAERRTRGRLWSATAFTGRRLTRRQRLWRVLTAVVAVTSAFAALTLSGRFDLAGLVTRADRPAALITGPVVAPRDGLVCLREVAWAPDARRLAALGVAGGCPVSRYAPAVVNVYDVAADRLVSRWQPDAAIFAALGLPMPAAGQVGPVLYQHVLLWSRDGRTLALTFFADISVEPRILSYDGVVLLNIATGRERVLLDREGGRGFGQIVLEWDLAAGAPAVLPYELPPAGPLFNLAAAPAYTWDGNGQFMSAATAENAHATATPIGNPNGDAIVTLWQPGIVSLIAPAASGTGRSAGVYTWSTTFAAWSPDGRYLIDGVTTGGRLELASRPTPSAETLDALQIGRFPALAPRDAGMARALEALGAAFEAGQALWLAWRPDGRVLAASPDGDDVTFYDSASGRTLARVRTAAAAGLEGGLPGGAMRWSPDGKWLVLRNGVVVRAERLIG